MIPPQILDEYHESKVFATKSLLIQESVKLLVIEAYATCKRGQIFDDDDNWRAIKEMSSEKPQWHTLFKNLVWRARQQSEVWDIFLVLLERGLIDDSGLRLKVNPYCWPTRVKKLVKMLLSLEAFKGHETRNTQFPGYYGHRWPYLWLATVIARSGFHCPGEIFAVIEDMGTFGVFDRKQLPISQQYYRCPAACSQGHRAGDFFGEWLPHGLRSKKSRWPALIEKRFQQVRRIESLWEEYIRDGVYAEIPEDQQESYLVQLFDSSNV